MPANGGHFSVSKIPFGAFRQIFAVCCAHNSSAYGEQIPHLQPDKYFASGTRPDAKCFRLCFLLAQKILRSLFRHSEHGSYEPCLRLSKMLFCKGDHWSSVTKKFRIRRNLVQNADFFAGRAMLAPTISVEKGFLTR